MQKRRIVHKYSECFKRQVVADLESGRVDSIHAAMRHYGITGYGTIQRWVQRFGKNHLLPKVVIVQTPDEKREIERLSKELAQAKEALGEQQIRQWIVEKQLELAGREYGFNPDEFKKKVDGTSPTK